MHPGNDTFNLICPSKSHDTISCQQTNETESSSGESCEHWKPFYTSPTQLISLTSKPLSIFPISAVLFVECFSHDLSVIHIQTHASIYMQWVYHYAIY